MTSRSGSAESPLCDSTRSTTPEGLATLATERDVVLEKIEFEEAVIAEAEARGFKVWGPTTSRRAIS